MEPTNAHEETAIARPETLCGREFWKVNVLRRRTAIQWNVQVTHDLRIDAIGGGASTMANVA